MTRTDFFLSSPASLHTERPTFRFFGAGLNEHFGTNSTDHSFHRIELVQRLELNPTDALSEFPRPTTRNLVLWLTNPTDQRGRFSNESSVFLRFLPEKANVYHLLFPNRL